MARCVARSIDKVFESKEKADKYVGEHKDEDLVNISGIDWSIEEWEWNEISLCKKRFVILANK